MDALRQLTARMSIRHRRVHLREGPPVSRTRLRSRSPPVSGDSQGTQRASPLRAGVVGRSPGTRRREADGGEAQMGRRSDPALLLRRLERVADAGHERRHVVQAARRVASCANRVRRADRRRQPGDVRQDAVDHLADFPEARLIILWGANPSTSGIHLVSYIREAQRRGAKLIVIDPRTTPLAKQADIHLAVRPGTDLPVALSIHRFLFEDGHADQAFLTTHARGADATARMRAALDLRTRRRRGRRVRRRHCAASPRCMRHASRRDPVRLRARSATATAAARRSRSSRCLRSPGSSANAAAAT